MSELGRGRIKFWYDEKGWGFIRRPGTTDLFVHAVSCGDDLPKIGDEVEFEIEPNPKKPGLMRACKVRIIGGDNG